MAELAAAGRPPRQWLPTYLSRLRYILPYVGRYLSILPTLP